ncbi:MAG TPA: DNA repair protein RecN [Candidatus Eisenbacteria bacterium]|nr:DNA repair protein RecN [Candidatus Eisenbacteria bacterium]
MLAWLSIQGLALVDSVELEFAPGLNVLTGETGAGKSLILGSVGLLLGERADASWLRAGEGRGAVEGTFDLSGRDDLIGALKALDVEPEDGRVVLRREITADGKSRAFVNGRGVLLGQLRAVGDLLVDLHGQHEHQQLLHADRQADFFDRWAGTWDARREAETDRHAVAEERRRVREAKATLERDRADEEALRADFAELEEAKLEAGDEETLLRDRERLAHRERLLASLTDAVAAIGDEDGGAETRLRRALKSVRAAAALDPGLLAATDEAEAVSESLSALASRIESERDRLLEDPADLDQVERRLDRIHRLKRKHRTDFPGLLTLREALGARVRSLDPGGHEVARMERALADRIASYDARVQALAERRSARATPFARAAGELLSRLGFGKAALVVTTGNGAPPAGGDRSRAVIDPAPIPALEFEFQPNPGEPPRPLRRIASGGELSRVMLAVKSLMAERDQVAALVFDEVDQGIGGAVGEEVGRLLRALGERRQVLCITHLPLIAAYADRQFLVSKGVSRSGSKRAATERTTTTVEPLGNDARVEEIARLLAGARVSDTTRRQARELLRAAQSPSRDVAEPASAPARTRRRAPGGRS